jgi:hypothetical protein
MGRYRNYQLLLNVACCLLVFCLVEFRPLVFGSCIKLVASLAFAFLLAFVVVHSPNVTELVAACLPSFPIARFSLVVDLEWLIHSETSIVAPTKPNLPPLFQRPPPSALL